MIFVANLIILIGIEHLHRFLLSQGINLYESLRSDYYNNFTLRSARFREEGSEREYLLTLFVDEGGGVERREVVYVTKQH